MTDIINDLPDVSVAGLKAIGLSYTSSQSTTKKQYGGNELTYDVSKLSFVDDVMNGCAGIGSTVASDINQKFQEVYPQTSTALGVNTNLATHGAPTQLSSTPAIEQVEASSATVGTKTFIIPVDTILTAASGNLYSVLAQTPEQTEIVINSSALTFLIVSAVNGTGYLLDVADTTKRVLTFTPPIVSTDGTTQLNTVEAVASAYNVDGTDGESLASATNRLVQVLQAPLNTSRASDYNSYILKNNIGTVTATGILNSNNITYSGAGYVGQNCGVYLASGGTVTTKLLNYGLTDEYPDALLFSRSVGSSVIDTVKTQLNNLQILGARPNVNTIGTQAIALIGGVATTNAFIKITVQLQGTYSAGQIIQIDDYNISVENLIKRECRRAICSQKFGASFTVDNNFVYTSSFISVSDIEAQLDTTLGTSTSAGTIGSFLATRQVEILTNDTGIGTYEYKPKIPVYIANQAFPTPSVDFSLTATLNWVYDISIDPTKIYSNINVVSL